MFAYEYDKTTKEETNLEMYKVAWALAGEASVEHFRKMGSLAVDNATAKSQTNPQGDATEKQHERKCQ